MPMPRPWWASAVRCRACRWRSSWQRPACACSPRGRAAATRQAAAPARGLVPRRPGAAADTAIHDRVVHGAPGSGRAAAPPRSSECSHPASPSIPSRRSARGADGTSIRSMPWRLWWTPPWWSRATRTASPSFSLLATVREFGLEQLRCGGRGGRLRDAHTPTCTSNWRSCGDGRGLGFGRADGCGRPAEPRARQPARCGPTPRPRSETSETAG